MEDLDFFVEVGLLVFEGGGFVNQVLLSVVKVGMDGSFLGSANGTVVFIISDGSGQRDDSLLPLGELTLVNVDFVFELELVVSGSRVSIDFVSLGLDDLSIDGLFEGVQKLQQELLNLVPSESFTTLELVKIDVTLVVINVTSTDFVRSSVLNGFIGIDGVVIGVNVLLFELSKFFVSTSLVERNEKSELLHEGLSLGQGEVFLVGNLVSNESEELKSELILLKTFNVVTVLGTSSAE